MKESLQEIKYNLDKSLALEDVAYTEINKFPAEEGHWTKRIIYTIYLK